MSDLLDASAWQVPCLPIAGPGTAGGAEGKPEGRLAKAGLTLEALAGSVAAMEAWIRVQRHRGCSLMAQAVAAADLA